MRKKISFLTMIYMLALILFVASGIIRGVMASVVYSLGFVLPVGLAICFSKDSTYTLNEYLSIDKQGIKNTVPLIAPTILIVVAISFITSLVMNRLTGATNTVDVGDSAVSAVLSFALIPAIMEELLFRYVPIRLLAPYSKRGAVIISAIFFALIHHNLFVIPYAFIAGVIFIVIDISAKSIIPSIIIHFINNALSVAIIMYGDIPFLTLYTYLLLGIISIISIAIIIKRRSEYKKIILCALDSGEKVKIPYEMFVFAAFALMLAFVSLI